MMHVVERISDGGFDQHLKTGLYNLYKKKIFCDVTLTCADGIELQAHWLVLSVHSDFLKQLAISRSVLLTLSESLRLNIESDVMTAILDYFYDGKLILTRTSVKKVEQAAKCLQLPRVLDLLKNSKFLDNSTVSQSSESMVTPTTTISVSGAGSSTGLNSTVERPISLAPYQSFVPTNQNSSLNMLNANTRFAFIPNNQSFQTIVPNNQSQFPLMNTFGPTVLQLPQSVIVPTHKPILPKPIQLVSGSAAQFGEPSSLLFNMPASQNGTGAQTVSSFSVVSPQSTGQVGPAPIRVSGDLPTQLPVITSVMGTYPNFADCSNETNIKASESVNIAASATASDSVLRTSESILPDESVGVKIESAVLPDTGPYSVFNQVAETSTEKSGLVQGDQFIIEYGDEDGDISGFVIETQELSSENDTSSHLQSPQESQSQRITKRGQRTQLRNPSLSSKKHKASGTTGIKKWKDRYVKTLHQYYEGNTWMRNACVRKSNGQGDTIYECKKCKRTYRTISVFKHHFFRVHMVRPHKGNIANKILPKTKKSTRNVKSVRLPQMVSRMVTKSYRHGETMRRERVGRYTDDRKLSRSNSSHPNMTDTSMRNLQKFANNIVQITPKIPSSNIAVDKCCRRSSPTFGQRTDASLEKASKICKRKTPRKIGVIPDYTYDILKRKITGDYDKKDADFKSIKSLNLFRKIRKYKLTMKEVHNPLYGEMRQEMVDWEDKIVLAERDIEQVLRKFCTKSPRATCHDDCNKMELLSAKPLQKKLVKMYAGVSRRLIQELLTVMKKEELPK